MTGRLVLAAASAVTLSAAVLMCLRIPYPSFKHLAANRRIRFTQFAAVPLCFALISLDAPRMLFTLFGVYVGIGPTLALWRAADKRRRRRAARAPE